MTHHLDRAQALAYFLAALRALMSGPRHGEVIVTSGEALVALVAADDVGARVVDGLSPAQRADLTAVLDGMLRETV